MVKRRIISAIIKNSNVQDENIVVLEYGLSKILMFLEDAVFTLVLGCLLGVIVESIIFQILFMLLRMCAGGFHFESKRKCQIFSALVTVVSLLGIRFFPDNLNAAVVVALLAGIVIVVLAPVEAINKPLSDMERNIYHKRTVIIVIAAGLVLVLDLMFGNYIFCKPIMVGIFAVSILMVIGKMGNKLYFD